jgi:hypothetical protein
MFQADRRKVAEKLSVFRAINLKLKNSRCYKSYKVEATEIRESEAYLADGLLPVSCELRLGHKISDEDCGQVGYRESSISWGDIRWIGRRLAAMTHALAASGKSTNSAACNIRRRLPVQEISQPPSCTRQHWCITKPGAYLRRKPSINKYSGLRQGTPTLFTYWE